MTDDAAILRELRDENEVLRHRLAEREQCAEQIRADKAAEILNANSALQRLVEKKTAELESINVLLRHAESELYQAQKMESIGRLAAGVAHEINTPIQFVNDSIFFLEQGLVDLCGLVDALVSTASEGGLTTAGLIESFDYDYLKEQTPMALDRARQGIERVAEIVRSMKAFSHPDRTTMRMVDLNEGLRNTLAIAKNEYKYVANIETNYGDIPLVECLSGEINQVFLNLIVNAAHAIEGAKTRNDEMGTITITTRREGDLVAIEISDTGTGIPEEARARVYDHFFTTKELGKGTGLGLAISHKVVTQMHSGQLDFTTEMGKGTTFFVRIPIQQDASRPAA